MRKQLLIYTAALLVTVTACFAEGTIFFLNPEEKALYSIRPDDVRPTRRLAGLPNIYHTSLSPDGLFFAVADDRERNFIDIFDVRNGGSRRIPLRRHFASFISWSPDGRWIAFSGNEVAPVNGLWRAPKEVFLLDLRTENVRQVTFGVGDVMGITWHPDSRALFYRRLGVHREVWEVEIDGNRAPEPYRVIPDGLSTLPPERFYSFSSSGDKLAYCTFGGVYVANADSTNRRKVTPNGFDFNLHVSWAPDARQLVFSLLDENEAAGPPMGLYIVSLATGEVRHLVAGPAIEPVWVSRPLAVNPMGKLATTWGAMKRP